MSAPGIPTNIAAQQANGQVLVTWNLSAGATSYLVQRSLDNVNFTALATAVTNQYVDSVVTIGVQYFYIVASSNGNASSYSSSVWAIPTIQGTLSLRELRLNSQQRSDRVNSSFVTDPEWNSYINESLTELYDIMETVYEDYFLAVPLSFTTDGSNAYDLPNGINYNKAMPFYKLVGVDCGLDNTLNANITVQKFNFIDRNRYVYPNITSTFLGVFNLRYRVMGSQLRFIPTPSAGQHITMWYTPRMTKLLLDTDISDGINGWLEFVIVDAAIKALQKEESDVSVLLAQKQALIERITTSAMNRDAGEGDTISATRRATSGWGTPNGSGSYGGY